jgi:1-acyl-sn-glycerol-3-phosphate acyltransferase
MPAPARGVIVVLNHISHVDTVLMARLIWQSGRVPRFLIKNTVFDLPGLGRLMRGAKQIPVYRGSEDAARSLREAVVALEDGEAVIIYAEGTITKDPAQWPMQAKTGAARLVLLSPTTPVVPIGQWGAQQTARRSDWLRRRLVQASVGEPLDMTKYAGREASAETLREITDEIMTAVRDEVALLRGEPAPKEFFKPIGKTRADGVRD